MTISNNSINVLTWLVLALLLGLNFQNHHQINNLQTQLEEQGVKPESINVQLYKLQKDHRSSRDEIESVKIEIASTKETMVEIQEKLLLARKDLDNALSELTLNQKMSRVLMGQIDKDQTTLDTFQASLAETQKNLEVTQGALDDVLRFLAK
jgi:chromosome segregation ATPase